MQLLAHALFSILLISSGCILASPSHKRAAAAAHWGQDAVSTELKEEQPETTETAVLINDDAAPEKEVRNGAVNNFPVEEPISNETVEIPSIQPIAEEEKSTVDAEESEEETVEEIVVTEAAVATALAEETEVDTPFPNIGKIQDIIEAGNSAMLGKVDLKNVSEKDILIAKEKDGDYHIHIRVPANKVTPPEDDSAVVPEIGDTTDLMDEETEGTEETATELDGEEVDATTTSNSAAGHWGKSPGENENSNVGAGTDTTGKPSTSNDNALGNDGLWSDTTTKPETTGGRTSGDPKQDTTKPETTKPKDTTKPKSEEASPPVSNWGNTQQSDVDLVSEKGKSTTEEVETLKPETAPEAEKDSWFRYNDGSLNYLAILAVMFFLFI